ncbi:2OG-Fe(II) oxygenase [Entomobacter blattae]|uniref:2OG-Fe(II) oxygenase n=1 Tax=Entomobacter blattae TaxID=2762277 RepID=A0A7H1NPT1_9PROT|nr:2OG-Fe(II) oxygenase [Entomobacter blattae]QNT77791.1 hypothetical protein JGUZn3_05450 [Entomobacter blattae]
MSFPSLIDTAQFSLETVRAHIQHALRKAKKEAAPYTHWLLEDVFPEEVCAALTAWDPGKSAIAGDTQGRRETHNANRVFINQAVRAHSKPLAYLAEVLDEAETRALFSSVTGSEVADNWLRMELCLDTDGFWLEPHTDIGAKKLTFLVSLSRGKGSEEWGTDIMNAEGQSLKRASGKFNSGLIFIPAEDTWHGFARRPIEGIRRTLIINFVDKSWRARHELAFEERA